MMLRAGGLNPYGQHLVSKKVHVALMQGTQKRGSAPQGTKALLEDSYDAFLVDVSNPQRGHRVVTSGNQVILEHLRSQGDSA